MLSDVTAVVMIRLQVPQRAQVNSRQHGHLGLMYVAAHVGHCHIPWSPGSFSPSPVFCLSQGILRGKVIN